MDIWLQKPASEEESYKLHKKLYEELGGTLAPLWQAHQDKCEHVCILIVEIIDNRFTKNAGTRNLRVRLDIENSSQGLIRISHDGLQFNDLEAAQRSEVVAGIINKLRVEYNSAVDITPEEERVVLTDTARAHQTIRFRF